MQHETVLSWLPGESERQAVQPRQSVGASTYGRAPLQHEVEAGICIRREQVHFAMVG